MTDYFRNGGVIYATFYTLWRGRIALQGLLMTCLYRRALGSCGKGTVFRSGVYITCPKQVQIGNQCYVGRGVRLASEVPESLLRIADSVVLSDDVSVDFTGGVSIGRRTVLSPRVTLLSHDHGYVPRAAPTVRELEIEEDVWIGLSALILPTVGRIGKGAIVGAGSVVTKPVEKWSVVAGNPAEVIKFRDVTSRE